MLIGASLLDHPPTMCATMRISTRMRCSMHGICQHAWHIPTIIVIRLASHHRDSLRAWVGINQMICAHMAVSHRSACFPAFLIGIHLGAGRINDDEGRGNFYRHCTADHVCVEDMLSRHGGQDLAGHHGSWHIPRTVGFEPPKCRKGTPRRRRERLAIT
jgi:hypothetical protein